MGERRRILIAEQESIAGAYIQKMMQKSGWDTELVSKGEEVIQRLSNEHFDALVISSQLSDRSGIEVIKEIRGMVEKQRIPVLGMADSSLATERKQMEKAGATHCLTKPVYQKQLGKVLRKALGLKKSNLPVA